MLAAEYEVVVGAREVEAVGFDIRRSRGSSGATLFEAVSGAFWDPSWILASETKRANEALR